MEGVFDMKKSTRVMSFALAFSMVFSIFSSSVMAEEDQEDISTETVAEISEESPAEEPAEIPAETSEEEPVVQEPETYSEPDQQEEPSRSIIVGLPAGFSWLEYIGGEYVITDDQGAETRVNDFPVSGKYKLRGDITLDTYYTISAELCIDLNSHDIIDNYTGTESKNLIVIDGGSFELSDSSFDYDAVSDVDDLFSNGSPVGGRIVSYPGNGSSSHTAIRIVNGSFTMNGGVIEGFAATSNGGAVNIPESATSSSTFTMNDGVIYRCSTSVSSGGGGVNIFNGIFRMKGHSLVTECECTCTQGTEKQGNGAGVQVGNRGTMYMSEYAAITNCHGTGYHGAGIDFWNRPTCNLYIEGSPLIIGNTNGRNNACNLYINKRVHISGPLELDYEDDNTTIAKRIGVTVEKDPEITDGFIDNGVPQGGDPDEYAELFFADRSTWPEYAGNPQALFQIEYRPLVGEVYQVPTVHIHLMLSTTEAWCDPNTGEPIIIEAVPDGLIDDPGAPGQASSSASLKYFNFIDEWHVDPNLADEPFKFADSNDPDKAPIDDHMFLYAAYEASVAGYIVFLDEGSVGIKCMIPVVDEEDPLDGYSVKLNGFRSYNPNTGDSSSSYTVDYDDSMEAVDIGNGVMCVAFPFKINSYELARDFTIEIYKDSTKLSSHSISVKKIFVALNKNQNIGNTNYPAAYYGNKKRLALDLIASTLYYCDCVINYLGSQLSNEGVTATATKSVADVRTYYSALGGGSPVPDLSSYTKSVLKNDSSDRISYYGSTLSYTSSIRIKHYLRLNSQSASDYTFTVTMPGQSESEARTFLLDGSGNYMYAYADIAAQDLDKTCTIKVYKGNTLVYTIGYSGFCFINHVISNRTESRTEVNVIYGSNYQNDKKNDVASALYYFWKAANAYLAG